MNSEHEHKSILKYIENLEFAKLTGGKLRKGGTRTRAFHNRLKKRRKGNRLQKISRRKNRAA